MQQELQITFRGMDPSPAVEERLRKETAALEQMNHAMIGCRVTIEAPHKSHRKGNLFEVRIDIHVPGREIVVGHDGSGKHANEDVYIAIRDSFAAAARQLEADAHKRQGRVKHHDRSQEL